MIAISHTIAALHRREQLERYAAFGAEVYRGNANWVAPDPHHLVASLAGDVPAAAHCDLQPFSAARGDQILATATALVDRAFNEHWSEAVGHVLFFEALPQEDDAAVGVLRAALEWLRARRCTTARLSFLYGWQLPLTVDAYDVPPTAFHTYNPPYYHRLVKAAGFETDSGQSEYRVQFTPDLANRYEAMTAQEKSIGVRLRSWDLDSPRAEALNWAGSYNEAFATHWGAPQFAPAELEDMIAGMQEVLVRDLTVFAEAGGRIVGSVFAMPDFNQLIRGADKIDHGVLLTISVTPAYRGRGLNLAMAARSYLAMIRHGYKSASYTTVLDSNRPSRLTAEKLGARVARNFVVYRRAL